MMEIVQFTPQDQVATVRFMEMIYEEMGWSKYPVVGADDLEKFFHVPDGGVLFVIKEKDKIVGTGGFVQLTDTNILLKRFFLAAEIRGTGMAQKLLEKLFVEAKRFKGIRLVLDATKTNKRAIRFYEKNGFKQYHQEPIAGWSETELPDIFNYYFLTLK